MRCFAVESAPLRVLAEGIHGGPAMMWDGEACVTQEQLLATAEGRTALEAWRRGDDSVYEVGEAADLALSEADDELIAAGSAARPDLHTCLRAASSAEEIDDVLNALRQAGAEVLGTR